MMALNHATLAATTALYLSVYQGIDLYLPVLILVIFAGVLPDIDHPKSELGRWFKPVGWFLPHRGVTHSILGAGLVYFLLNLLLNQDSAYFTYFLIVGSLFGLFLCEKILRKHILSIDEYSGRLISEKQAQLVLKLMIIVAYFALFILLFLVWNQQLRQQIFYFINIAYISHLFGDFITIEGIPLLWPNKSKWGLRLFKTGGKIEGLLGFVLFCSCGYLLYRYNLQTNILNAQYWTRYLRLS
jgi:membrane-bound metal-dependent hydrolase YbcI (DUF457 family)